MRTRLIPDQRSVPPPRPSRGPTAPVTVTVTLAPHGPLEHASTAALRRSLALLTAVPGADVVLDLHAVPCVDGAVASVLSACQGATEDRGGRFRVRGARSQPRDLLTVHGVRLTGTVPGGCGDDPLPSPQL